MAFSFVQGIGKGESGLYQRHNTHLRDAVAGRDGLWNGGKIVENHFQLAAKAGVDEPGECVQAAQRNAGSIGKQGAEAGGQPESETGRNGRRFTRCKRGGGNRVQVGGKIAKRAHMRIARQLGGGMEALDGNVRSGRRGGKHVPSLVRAWCLIAPKRSQLDFGWVKTVQIDEQSEERSASHKGTSRTAGESRSMTMGLNVQIQGSGQSEFPALVLMHFLGGSGREWDEVVALLGSSYRTVRIDLPGFGGSAGETGYTVQAMADAVQEAIATASLGAYILVGHSMSGKVSAVLARRAEDADKAEDRRLRGLVLVAPSPPGPEPMGDDKRSMMLGLLGGPAAEGDYERALSYVNKNETRDIPHDVEERTANEVLRMNRTAWVAWLEHGSKEDWAGRVGVLRVPALVVAGEKDASLGPKQQGETTMEHLGRARLVAVEGCSHLIPLERPEQMANLLREFCAQVKVRATIPAEYVAFLSSDRVSEPTKAVLAKRMAGPGESDGVLNAQQQRTLYALLERVVPASGLDLVGYVMAQLASGKGDGWRYAMLPSDVQAYRDGLDRLAAKKFAEMTGDEQDEALKKMAAGKDTVDARWFEEVRGAATEAYVGHPATLARWGYSGFGVGGAYTPHRGFVQLGLNERESWEPLATPVPARAEVKS